LRVPIVNIPSKVRPRHLLQSIHDAGTFILSWTQDMNEHRLWADKLRRAAVERQFEVISESLYRLRVLEHWSWLKLSDPETALRLGDAIRRDFDCVDYGILWRATRRELPQLLREVEGLLADPNLDAWQVDALDE